MDAYRTEISATINLDYADWGHIRGISLAGNAGFVQGAGQIERVAGALLYKFPAAKSFAQAAGPMPWQGLLFLRIDPTVISLLDYSLGFGHTELYAVGTDGHGMSNMQPFDLGHMNY